MNTITKTTDPIDHAIVAVLFLIEGICWIINELAGLHTEPAPEVTPAPEPVTVRLALAAAPVAPRPEPALLPRRAAPSLKVTELRKLAREAGHKQAGGRRIAQARRADLEALLA